MKKSTRKSKARMESKQVKMHLLREASDAIAVRRVNSDAAFRTTFSRVWRFTLFAFASVIFTWLKYACVSLILTQGRVADSLHRKTKKHIKMYAFTRRVSKLKYANFTLTLRQPYAAEIAALSAASFPCLLGEKKKKQGKTPQEARLLKGKKQGNPWKSPQTTRQGRTAVGKSSLARGPAPP